MQTTVSGKVPTLQVEDLKTYFFTKGGVAKAVDGVSFSLQPGEVMGLVGESGSGKSMTGYSIVGLIDRPGEVVSGRIMFQGQAYDATFKAATQVHVLTAGVRWAF